MANSTGWFEDGVLVKRCLAGEKDAWSSLVGQHQRRLVRLLTLFLARLRCPHLSPEDLAEEAWCAMTVKNYARLRRYESSRGSFFNFLTAVAVQKGLQARRHRDRIREVPLHQCPPEKLQVFDDHLTSSLEEIVAAFTPREHQYYLECLNAIVERISTAAFTRPNARQLERRISRKMHDYLADEEGVSPTATLLAKKVKKTISRLSQKPPFRH